MYKLTSLLLAAALSTGVAAQGKYPGVGRTATPAEIKAWDIDVRPDFKGLPRGSGSVKSGEEIWEAKCASCHGTFGESNSVFAPISGGTSRADIEKGRTASLLKPEQGRTTLMKLSQISTLWDYVNRAMPWNAPKTLSPNEVYAVVAFILNLGEIVPEDFVLSDTNIAEVQKRLPNRNGMTRAHGLWDPKGRPDVNNTACMKDCTIGKGVVSQLPDYARSAHGNLAEQARTIGPVRGVHTTAATGSPTSAQTGNPAKNLAEKSGCLACHGISTKILGPALHDIAAKYKTDSAAEARLAAKIKDGSQGAWGPVPMPPHTHIAEDDIRALVRWILGGAG